MYTLAEVLFLMSVAYRGDMRLADNIEEFSEIGQQMDSFWEEQLGKTTETKPLLDKLINRMIADMKDVNANT